MSSRLSKIRSHFTQKPAAPEPQAPLTDKRSQKTVAAVNSTPSGQPIYIGKNAAGPKTPGQWVNRLLKRKKPEPGSAADLLSFAHQAYLACGSDRQKKNAVQQFRAHLLNAQRHATDPTTLLNSDEIKNKMQAVIDAFDPFAQQVDPLPQPAAPEPVVVEEAPPAEPQASPRDKAEKRLLDRRELLRSDMAKARWAEFEDHGPLAYAVGALDTQKITWHMASDQRYSMTGAERAAYVLDRLPSRGNEQATLAHYLENTPLLGMVDTTTANALIDKYLNAHFTAQDKA
jgi:hypothetical protein